MKPVNKEDLNLPDMDSECAGGTESCGIDKDQCSDNKIAQLDNGVLLPKAGKVTQDELKEALEDKFELQQVELRQMFDAQDQFNTLQAIDTRQMLEEQQTKLLSRFDAHLDKVHEMYEKKLTEIVNKDKES